MEQLDTEVVETVAGVARLLRRAAELVWTQADAAGPRSSHQLLALGIDFGGGRGIRPVTSPRPTGWAYTSWGQPS
jgi:hypothetical protein